MSPPRILTREPPLRWWSGLLLCGVTASGCYRLPAKCTLTSECELPLVCDPATSFCVMATDAGLDAGPDAGLDGSGDGGADAGDAGRPPCTPEPIARSALSLAPYQSENGVSGFLLIGGLCPETGQPLRQVDDFVPGSGFRPFARLLEPRARSAVAGVGHTPSHPASVMVFGGGSNSLEYLSSTNELFDVVTSYRLPGGDLGPGLAALPAVESDGGGSTRFLVAGGEDSTGAPSPQSALVACHNPPRPWDCVDAGLVAGLTGRRNFALLTLDDAGAVLAVGGIGGIAAQEAPRADQQLFRAAGGGWEPPSPTLQLGLPRADFALVSDAAGRVYAIGGAIGVGAQTGNPGTETAASEMEIWDSRPGDAGWRDAGPVPYGGRIDSVAAFLPDAGSAGQIAVFFGASAGPGSVVLSSYDLFDLASGAWTTCPVGPLGDTGPCRPSCFTAGCDAGI